MIPILDPLKHLLYSRKFLVLFMDAVISIALHYLPGQDTSFLVAVLQPVAMAIILAIAIEDAAEKRGRFNV